jgi:hypothetical protein
MPSALLPLVLLAALVTQVTLSRPPLATSRDAVAVPFSLDKPARDPAFPGEYVDFAVQMQFRLATDDAEGAVLVRAWANKIDGWPGTGYRIGLSRKAGAPDRPRRLS